MHPWYSHQNPTGASYIYMACYNTAWHDYGSILVVASSCRALSFFAGRERFATPTGFCCIWILEGEATADKRVAVVQLHSKHEEKALWITYYCKPIIFYN